MSKAPDFVIRDTAGKWHVLECKGTQSSRAYQIHVLKTAVAQKHSIQLLGSVRGEQLASSLYIAHEKDKSRSHMKVIDPEADEPLIRLGGEQAEEMHTKADRLLVAQALGSIGLNEAAVEMSLPLDIDVESELLLPSELSRLRSPREERVTRAAERTRARNLDIFTHRHQRYEGRVADFELPSTGVQLPYRKVRIRRGVAADIVQELASAESLLDQRLDDQIRPYTASARIAFEVSQDHSALMYGDMLYSELEWIR